MRRSRCPTPASAFATAGISSNTGTPIIFDKESPAGRAYDDAVARFLGEQRELRFVKPERRSLFRALFGRA